MNEGSGVKYHGFTINREPVPMMVDGQEVTGWDFTVQDTLGNPIPVEVTARDRHVGLRETKKAVKRYQSNSASLVA
jgi:hypothetical protein